VQELLRDAQAQASTVRRVEHRPWPLPREPWLMGQTWRELLFAHWRVPPDQLRPHVPRRLELEEFDGSAWVGITPFTLTGLRLRGLPPLTLVSSFYELNCRTYVRVADRPGIWFFSLDASSRLAVEAARRVYRLPYEHASISRDPFVAERRGDPGVAFRASFGPAGDVFEARPGTLEHFLTERYCLYADDGRARADIHHPPWPLQAAEAEVDVSGLAPTELEGEPVCHFAARQDVVVWPLRPM
jgi:uncharacterized protein YqjF (DUF2071 family)